MKPNEQYSRRQIPDWFLKQEGMTRRAWKKLKRKELSEIIRALNTYRLGCAYTNGDTGEVDQIKECLERLKERQSVKEWGR